MKFFGKSESKSKKTYGNTPTSPAKVNVPDIQSWGKEDLWKLISKASSQEEGWMKSTKAMYVVGTGCFIQVTTQQSDNVAESLVFVAGIRIFEQFDEEGKVISRTLGRI